MDKYIVKMIAEHRDLVARLKKLEDYIYSDKSDNDDRVEFANKCIQLKAMRVYEEALNARLSNAGVEYNPVEKTYYNQIKFGSDFDADKEK